MIVAHDKNVSSEPSQPREERPAKTFFPTHKKLTSDKAAAEQKEKSSTVLKEKSATEHKEKSGPDHKEKRRDAFPEEPKKRMPSAAERWSRFKLSVAGCCADG